MRNDTITFKKLQETDIVLLHQWFQIPHVLKWYAREKAYTFKEIQEKYLPRINDATVPSYIVYDGDKPVGYIQYYQIEFHFPEGVKNNQHPLFDEFNPTELAGLDLFIADENYLRTGYSSNVLKTFINKYLKNDFKAALVDPYKNNVTAIKFFEKNGFRHILSQDRNHDLMLLKLESNMKYTIQYEKNPHPDDIQILNDGIMKEHKIKKEMKPLDFFAYFIRDDQNQIVGGCAGDNMYGGLFVGQLWVKEELRRNGYGAQLMSSAEDLARKSQCRFITVNTFGWEALNFYKNLGFYIEFERHGFDKDSIFYFLRKDLSE